MPEPLVSFLLPVYNGSAGLREALESLGRQTERNFEIVAIDDGSSDASWDILTSFPDARLRPIRHPVNRGLANTLNHCMEAARGQFFARMDQDDISHPERLERQIGHLGQHRHHGACGSAVQVFRENARQGIWRYPLRPEHVKACLTFASPCAHPTLMMRREVFDAGNLYDSEYELAEDWDFLDRVSRTWPISNLSAPLLDYRLSPGGIGRYRANQQWEIKQRMAERMLARLGIPIHENSLQLHLEATNPRKRGPDELIQISKHLRLVWRTASQKRLADRFLAWEILWRWMHLCRAAGPGAWKQAVLECPIP